MDNKNDNSNSENGSLSDDVELFDDIFSEGMDAGVHDTKKEKPPSPAPTGKEVSSKPVKKLEQRPEPPKALPPIKKAATQTPPIKKGPSVEPSTPKEKQPGSGSEHEALSDLFDDIFIEEMAVGVPKTEKEQPPVPATPVKAAPSKDMKKVEQRPVPPKEPPPPAKKPEPSATPIKKEAPVETHRPKEEIKASSTTTSDKKPPQVPIKKVEQRPESIKVPPVEKVTPPAPVVKSERSFESDTYLDKRPDTDEESGEKEIEKMEFYEKPKKNVNPFIFISSIVVLVILSMLAGRVVNYDGLIQYVKTTRYFKSDKKNPVRIADNKIGKSRGPISNLKTSSLVIKDEKSKMEGSNIQASQTLKEETPPVINNKSSEKAVPVRDADKLIPTEDRSKNEASTVSNAPLISEKASNEKAYPYSIYLGSYSNAEAVNKAISDYKEMGLSLYWIKMDLGKKGIWFRLFAGYFQTREEVDKFIKTKQIPDAELKKIDYVNLIGIYASEEEVNKQKEILEKMGYCPYVISDNKNIFRLYVGAFYEKDTAEEQNADLLLKGIQSKVVQR